jgi:hypothetical protein
MARIDPIEVLPGRAISEDVGCGWRLSADDEQPEHHGNDGQQMEQESPSGAATRW